MIWKDYSQLRNTHAFLSASRYFWLRYDETKLITAYQNHQKIALGSKLHSLAADLITMAVRLPESSLSLNAFVNDAIGYRMTPEVVLFYSANAYGTADAISYNDGILRIHDLKTGTTPASIDQLLIYAAFFILSYKEIPKDTYLRIYQNNEIIEHEPSYEEIRDVADKIVAFDRLLEEVKDAVIF